MGSKNQYRMMFCFCVVYQNIFEGGWLCFVDLQLDYDFFYFQIEGLGLYIESYVDENDDYNNLFIY